MKESKYTVIFSLSCITSYTEESILEFMKLSGLQIEETRMILKDYSRLGINSLREVNLFLKLGHIKYNEFNKKDFKDEYLSGANNEKHYPNLDWENAIFKPVHLGGSSAKEVIPNYAITEPCDPVLLKKRIDDFVSELNIDAIPEFLYISPKYFSAIKDYVIDGKYEGMTVKTDERHPKNLIYANSKYHK